MKLYRISKCRFVDDLSGTGAALYGGRWNSKGTYILYTAASPALALLESIVHLSHIPVSGYCMITLEIPDGLSTEIKDADLPSNWQQHPPPAGLKKIGDRFVKENKSLALKIPSALLPEDFNFLLNPNHSQFSKIKLTAKRTLVFDDRLKKE
jgi:RES domain-containing protein